jgi:hypothetical protein
MSDLVEFTSAEDWRENVFVDPDEVILIKRRGSNSSMDMSPYSTLTLRNGAEVAVSGSPTVVAKKIRDSRSDKGGES